MREDTSLLSTYDVVIRTSRRLFSREEFSGLLEELNLAVPDRAWISPG
jgi:hypothetical protein